MKKVKLADFKLMFWVIAFFACVAVVTWQAHGAIFYVYNFAIIGSSLALGMGLWPLMAKPNKPWARRLSQFLVGGYLFVGLGLGQVYRGIGIQVPENMQIEGFWFLLFAGIFMGAVIHYFVAKIFGPTLMNRGWCGWACWTTAILDLLPWKKSPGRLPGRWGHLRYIHFAVALALVLVVAFVLGHGGESHMGYVSTVEKLPFPMTMKQYGSIFEIPETWWFLVGNILYFGAGIGLAVALRDNRAFCKYLCPIVGFLKPSARLAVPRIAAVNDRCTSCGQCELHCPMDIQIQRYVKEGKRVLSTECILCLTCTSACARDVLGVTMGFDFSREEYLRTMKASAPGESARKPA